MEQASQVPGSPFPGTCSKKGSVGRGEEKGSCHVHTERQGEDPPNRWSHLCWLHQSCPQNSGHTSAHRTH